MIEPDLDDTHLCIKCNSTIIGLENYIQHRKHSCNIRNVTNVETKIQPRTESNEPSSIISAPSTSNLNHSYDTFGFTEPEPLSSYVSKSEHGGKTSKTLSDPYDLPYELGADVFFSSLQLQSVQSAVPSTGGKTGAAQQPLHRQKSQPEHPEVTWIDTTASTSGQHSTDNLMKAVSDISENKKPYEGIFKPITFAHESPDGTEDEEEEEVDVEIDDEEDEVYDPIAASHASGGKWKPSIMRHSPPVVPVTHTGGKWKPENRPNLRVTHTQLTRISPNWEDQAEEVEPLDHGEGEHPPAGHTKGKWIPGTKLQRLEYKEEVELKKTTASQGYWCNICCRKLKNKHIYESHLKTAYHLKRAEPEQQLEKAALGDIDKNFSIEEPKVIQVPALKKRKRRANFVKCEICKHLMSRHLFGKHLISHYHYRRMQLNPSKSFRMVLDNIHSIVLQSPFQCRPCSFYANTEENFLLHWNSPQHLDASEGPGKFWCSYCHFECEDNNQMRRHLLSSEHKEVILAINRSVPIFISKKLSIDCPKCRLSFHYNHELRKHIEQLHPEGVVVGTASDKYQSRFVCEICSEVLRSKVALQRHEKNQHFLSKYFCTICNLEFDTPCKARRHRKTLEHRLRAASTEKQAIYKNRLMLKKKFGVRNSQGDSRLCDKCDFVPSSEVEAMLHELTHPSVELLKSTEATAETKPRVESTRSISKKTITLKCKDCEASFSSLNELKEHRDKTHPLLSHVCMSCGQSFALAQALGRHSRSCQPSTSAEAAASEQPPTSQLQEEKSQLLLEKSWKCNDCQFSASYESELIYHRLHHTLGPISKNQLINCPLCSKSFRKHSLRCHLRQHTNEKIFECEYCHLKFARHHNLKNHINLLHLQPKEKIVLPKETTKSYTTQEISERAKEEPAFQCDTCGKVYRKKHALKLHTRLHVEDEKHFLCSFEGCLYAATSNAILNVHLKSHSKQNFHCVEENCNYVGKSSMHLKRHLQSHKEPKKLFNCTKCEFRTKISGHLKRHLRSHSGEKPYKCPHCEFSSATLENLRKHILKTNKHPGKFIYECDVCKRMQSETPGASMEIFRTNEYQGLQSHIAKAHTTKGE